MKIVLTQQEISEAVAAAVCKKFGRSSVVTCVDFHVYLDKNTITAEVTLLGDPPPQAATAESPYPSAPPADHHPAASPAPSDQAEQAGNA